MSHTIEHPLQTPSDVSRHAKSLISFAQRAEELQERGELCDPRNVENFGDALCDWAYSDNASELYAEVLNLASSGRKDLAFDMIMFAVNNFCEAKAKLQARLESEA
jgi:uncharacterized protein YkuJ